MHLLSLTLSQAASLLAPKPSQKLCGPMTIQHLECLCAGLDFDDPFDTSVFAIACLAFWSQACLRELLLDKAFDPSLQMT